MEVNPNLKYGEKVEASVSSFELDQSFMLSTSIFHTEGTCKAMVKECAWCSQEKVRPIMLKHRNLKTTKGFTVY